MKTLVPSTAGEDMEFVACPRCGSSDGTTVVEGRDYLHSVEGNFFAWQCAQCHLQYQNPRPTANRLAQLYPSDYAPHRERALASELADVHKESTSAGPSRSVLGLLRSGSMRLLHSFSYRTGILPRTPDPREMETFLSQCLVYPTLKSQSELSRSKLSPRVERECRRLAGIDLIPHFVPGGRLLEIGCATGDRLQSYGERGWQDLTGIELVEQAAVQAQQRGFSVTCGPVEPALSEFPDESFDVIVSSMVLEHLYDPFTVVKTIARKLKRDGQFLFSTVTLDGLDARWFGKYWGGYDFPRHMVYMRTRDIHKMLSVEFAETEWFHQNAPIDFLRSATWRAPEKRFGDRFIAKLAQAPLGSMLGEVLARAGQTCRVSFRCQRKLTGAKS